MTPDESSDERLIDASEFERKSEYGGLSLAARLREQIVRPGPWLTSMTLAAAIAVVVVLLSFTRIWWQEFLTETAAALTGGIILAIALTPLARSAFYQISNADDTGFWGFPNEDFASRLGSMVDIVRIADTALNFLGVDSNQDAQISDIQRRIESYLVKQLRTPGIAVEIVLGRQAVNATNVELLRSIKYLNGLYWSLPSSRRIHLRVRLIETVPAIRYYRVDDRALISFPELSGPRGEREIYLRVALNSMLGKIANDYFRQIFHTATPAFDILHCVITVGRQPPLSGVAFVEHGGTYFVSSYSDTRDASLLGQAVGMASLQGPDFTVECRIGRTLIGDEPLAQTLGDAFYEKYLYRFKFFVSLRPAL